MVGSMEEEVTVARVSIGMTSEVLEPEDVTRIVGVQPTRAFKRGDRGPNRRVPAPRGVWAYEVTSDDVGPAAAELLRVIEPLVPVLRQAAGKYEALLAVGVCWQPEGGQGGYSLPADLVRRLSMLGERVDFYFS